MDGQLIIVYYNNRKNAFSGERNRHKVLKIENKLDIAPMIEAQVRMVKNDGYVLVKYAGNLYICEREATNPKASYRKHKITYHPLEKEFAQG